MQLLTQQLRFCVFCPIDIYSHMQSEALFGNANNRNQRKCFITRESVFIHTVGILNSLKLVSFLRN